MSRKPLPAKLRRTIKDRDGWRCVRCWSPDYLEVHHVVAVADGGPDDPENLVTLCSRCHGEWTFVVEPSINISQAEWMRLPSYHMLLSFWRSMQQCGTDGAVIMANGSPMEMADRAQEMERAMHSLRATRQRERRPGEQHPSCRVCHRPFPERLPYKVDEFPEVCRYCDPNARPLHVVYTAAELQEAEAQHGPLRRQTPSPSSDRSAS